MGFSFHGKLKCGTVLAVAILMLILAVPALADYLGPDRTVITTDVEYYDYGVWAQQFDLSQCPDSQYGLACIVCSWEDDPFTASCAYDYEYGYPNFYWIKIGTQARTVIHTTTYPEAAVSGALQNCTLQNGWCVTTPSLEITGGEPLNTLLGPQYYIMAIEGTRNGQTFACSESTCNVSLVEGANSFEFWAISTWGDTSQMGTLSANVDTQPPGITGQVSGTTGDNGWYVTPAEVSASASDVTSGVAAFEYSLDGSALTPYTDPISLPDGDHTIVFQAVDVAGLTASVSQTVNVDTQPPQIDLTTASSFCPGCGQPLDIVISADDVGSGIAAWRLVADGATVLIEGTASASQPFSWNGDTFPAGMHTLVLEASDAAGNVSQVGMGVALLLPPESPVDDSPVAPAIRPAGPIPPLSTQPSVPTQPAVQVFGSNPPTQAVNNRPSDEEVTIAESETPVPTDSSSSNVLWGVAAAGLIGAATAIAVDQWRKRKQSEIDQQVDAAIQAAAFNAQQHPKGSEYEIPREDQAGKDDGVGGSKDKSGQGKKGTYPASSEPIKDKSTKSGNGKEPATSWLQQGTNWLQAHVLAPAGNWINQPIPVAQPATKTGKLGGRQNAADKKGNSPLKNAAVVGATLFGIGAAGYLAWPWLEDTICGPGAKLNPFSGLPLGLLPVIALAVSSKGMRVRSSALGLLAMLMILSACGPVPATSLPPDATATTEWPCTPTLETPASTSTIAPALTSTSVPFTWPSATFTATDNVWSCFDVATHFGWWGYDYPTIVTYNNSHNNPIDCNAIVPNYTEFMIPPLPLEEDIGNYVVQYQCTPNPPYTTCLSPADSPVVMLAHTLYGEGGSTMGNGFSANVMQIIKNRSGYILGNYEIDPNTMPNDVYGNLLIFVVSQPGDVTGTIANFNAFSSPIEAPNSVSQVYWDGAMSIGQYALSNPNRTGWLPPESPLMINPLVENPDVMFYCSIIPIASDGNSAQPPLGYTARIPDANEPSNPSGTITYFFTRYQYNGMVDEWCRQYAP